MNKAPTQASFALYKVPTVRGIEPFKSYISHLVRKLEAANSRRRLPPFPALDLKTRLLEVNTHQISK